jgi:hypothetical protein
VLRSNTVPLVALCVCVTRWSYSPFGDSITWLHGSSGSLASLAALESNYTVQGKPSPIALPYPRHRAAGTQDSQGRLYMHGGQAVDASGNILYPNDL